MKKSSRYIYARPIPKKRPSVWRPLMLMVCLTIMACFFFYQKDGVKLGLISDSEAMASVVSVEISPADTGFFVPDSFYVDPGSAENLLSDSLNLGVDEDSIAAVVAKAADLPAQNEQPVLQLASLGQKYSGLFHNLPFYLPDINSKEALPIPPFSDLFEDLFPLATEESLDSPQIYPHNERYTVEYNQDGHQILHSEIVSGDTCGVLLNEWISNAEVMQMVEAAEPVHSLTRIRAGNPFTVIRDPDNNQLISFIYEIDQSNKLVVERSEDGFVARTENIVYDTQLVRVMGTITSSLFEAITETGEGASLAITMSDIFSCEVNFITQIRQGDSFELLVEKQYRNGEFKHYGQMLAGHFTNRGSTYEAYLFPDENGKLHYYNAQGEAIQRLLLKAPLSYTRISSSYSMSRVHPVFGDARPHQGVDYAAPRGTPIVAVGDGVVTKAGWGSGYGNMVIVEHAGGLESQYAHMSGFANGIKNGVQVRQGQTIGYVGSTGTATGPHLDFRLKQNSNWVNPETLIVPRLDPVDVDRMPVFQNLMAQALSYLHGETELAEYVPITWDE